jgi:hypothetical protein
MKSGNFSTFQQKNNMVKCVYAGATEHLDMGDINPECVGTPFMFRPVRGMYRVIFECGNLPNAARIERE